MLTEISTPDRPFDEYSSIEFSYSFSSQETLVEPPTIKRLLQNGNITEISVLQEQKETQKTIGCFFFLKKIKRRLAFTKRARF